jgi:hypothetical protein
MKTSEMSDREFLAAFESMAIPGNEFRHGDHVRLAWIYLQDSDFASGATRFCEHFHSYVEHIGAQSKYHETITWFYLVTVYERIHTQTTPERWGAFADSNSDLLDNEMAVVRARYRDELLSSPLARRIFVLPDLARETNPTSGEVPSGRKSPVSPAVHLVTGPAPPPTGRPGSGPSR